MTIWLWIGFLVFVALALGIDLGVLNRRPHAIKTMEALGWTAMWVSLALLFTVFVYFAYQYKWLGIGLTPGMELDGKQAALEFIAGYLIEESLSVDNMIVIAMVFSFFGIPLQFQHRVLFWGIIGAVVMRGIMIAAGTALIAKFTWILYVFGALLLITAVRLMTHDDENVNPEKSLIVRLARKIYPMTNDLHGSKFFVKVDGVRMMTPMFLVLLVVESSDVLFAVDSIPAVIGVTREPFLVFTSNVFAILGLRSLYFALAGMVQAFRYLKPALVVLLAFIGVKLIVEHHYPISTSVSFGIILGILATGVIASLVAGPKKKEAREHSAD